MNVASIWFRIVTMRLILSLLLFSSYVFSGVVSVQKEGGKVYFYFDSLETATFFSKENSCENKHEVINSTAIVREKVKYDAKFSGGGAYFSGPTDLSFFKNHNSVPEEITSYYANEYNKIPKSEAAVLPEKVVKLDVSDCIPPHWFHSSNSNTEESVFKNCFASSLSTCSNLEKGFYCDSPELMKILSQYFSEVGEEEASLGDIGVMYGKEGPVHSWSELGAGTNWVFTKQGQVFPHMFMKKGT